MLSLAALRHTLIQLLTAVSLIFPRTNFLTLVSKGSHLCSTRRTWARLLQTEYREVSVHGIIQYWCFYSMVMALGELLEH